MKKDYPRTNMTMLTNNTDRILIDSLFSQDVVTEQADPTLAPRACYFEEKMCVKRAQTKRRQEFATGRLCARRALSRLGIRDFPLLVGIDGEPVWPKDVAGSISHAEGYCGVVVARKDKIESLGFDVEATGRLSSDCWRLICTYRELSWIDSLSFDNAQKNATVIFSAKECLYKCQHAISKQWLDFKDVMITVNHDAGEFEATFLIDVGTFFKKGTSVRGKYFFCRGYVFTGISIPRVKN